MDAVQSQTLELLTSSKMVKAQEVMLEDPSIRNHYGHGSSQRVVWGECGRAPRIDKSPGSGGRNHWPLAAFALLAGGSMRTGQIIGPTDRLAIPRIVRSTQALPSKWKVMPVVVLDVRHFESTSDRSHHCSDGVRRPATVCPRRGKSNSLGGRARPQ